MTSELRKRKRERGYGDLSRTRKGTRAPGSEASTHGQFDHSVWSERSTRTHPETPITSFTSGFQRWIDLINTLRICTEKRPDQFLFFLVMPLTIAVTLWLTHRLVIKTSILYAALWSNEVEHLRKTLRELLWLSACLSVWRVIRAALNERIARQWRERLSAELHAQLTGRPSASRTYLAHSGHSEARDQSSSMGKRNPLFVMASDAALAQQFEQVTTTSVRVLSVDLVSLITGGGGGSGGLLEHMGTAVWQLRKAYCFMPSLVLILGLVYVLGSYGLIWFLTRRTERATVDLDAAETSMRAQYTSMVEEAESLTLCSCGRDEFDTMQTQLASCCLAMQRQLRYRLPLVFVQHASSYGNAWMAYAAAALAFDRSKTGTLEPGASEKRVQWTAQLIAELMQLLGSLSGLLQFTVDLRHHALHANRLFSLWRSLQSYPQANRDQSMSTGRDHSDVADLLWLENIRVRIPGSNQILLQDLSIRVSVGQHTLIEGSSGSGKSSLMRALRGIWSLEVSTSTKQSRLLLPTNALFLPTEPHLPVRSGAFRLSECLRYGCCRNLSACSAADHALEDDTMRMCDTIRRVGLSSKVNSAGGVHACARWSQVLSRAEQQRLSIARVLYLRPALVIMDESLRGLVENAATTLLKACMDDAITVLYMRPHEHNWFDLFPHRYGIDSKGRLRRMC